MSTKIVGPFCTSDYEVIENHFTDERNVALEKTCGQNRKKIIGFDKLSNALLFPFLTNAIIMYREGHQPSGWVDLDLRSSSG